MIERESTAIRRYAPKFNTSIPSVSKSLGRMPKVIGVAAVFQDQEGPGGAFDPNNLQLQAEKAQANPKPPWKKVRTRKKAKTVAPRCERKVSDNREHLSEDFFLIRRSFSVTCRRPLPFKINLCDGGDVITKDGVVIGVWELDVDRQISFQSINASEPLFIDMSLGRLCTKIREWYETNTGDIIY